MENQFERFSHSLFVYLLFSCFEGICYHHHLLPLPCFQFLYPLSFKPLMDWNFSNRLYFNDKLASHSWLYSLIVIYQSTPQIDSIPAFGCGKSWGRARNFFFVPTVCKRYDAAIVFTNDKRSLNHKNASCAYKSMQIIFKVTYWLVVWRRWCTFELPVRSTLSKYLHLSPIDCFRSVVSLANYAYSFLFILFAKEFLLMAWTWKNCMWLKFNWQCWGKIQFSSREWT